MVIDSVKCGRETASYKNSKKIADHYVAICPEDTPSSCARKAPAIFMNS